MDHTSATLDMVLQGALSIDDASRQSSLDVKPLNVDMDVFSRDFVVCFCILLLKLQQEKYVIMSTTVRERQSKSCHVTLCSSSITYSHSNCHSLKNAPFTVVQVTAVVNVRCCRAYTQAGRLRS